MTRPLTSSEIANEIRALRKRACTDVIEIGRLLVEAKKKVRHGPEHWAAWLRREFAWSRQTADNFINVYRTFGGGVLKFSTLDVSALYALARPSTPAAARTAVQELLAAKTPPSFTDVQQIIRDAKPAPEPKAKPPSARQAALGDEFKVAVTALMKLSTKRAADFAGLVPAQDLEMLGNFLQQIARADVEPAEPAIAIT